MNIRENKGITIVSIIVVVILLLIIAGISINGTIKGDKKTEDAVKFTELNMIKQVILERYTKSKLTKENLPGTAFSSQSELDDAINAVTSDTGKTISLKDTNYANYKRLSKEDLSNLGVENEGDSYIVNYNTGEVINETVKITSEGNILYTY